MGARSHGQEDSAPKRLKYSLVVFKLFYTLAVHTVITV